MLRRNNAATPFAFKNAARLRFFGRTELRRSLRVSQACEQAIASRRADNPHSVRRSHCKRLPKRANPPILGKSRAPATDMNVSQTDELSEFVKEKISSGRYASASEVVREALRLMEQTEEDRLAFLRNAWAEGQASGDAGPADFGSIKAEARQALKDSDK
jgi:antitoxin ParD1/3/4